MLVYVSKTMCHVKKRTRLLYIFISIGILSLVTYNPKIVLNTKNISLGISNFLNDKTFPSPNDPRARCSLENNEPWYQRLGPCWE